MLSKDDIGKKLRELLAGVDLRDSNALDMVMRQHFAFLTENYDKFDAEAKKSIDQMTNSLLAQAKENIEIMEDGVSKRQAERLLETASGSHHDSNFLIKILEKKTDNNLKILEDTRVIFIKRLQTVLDLLLDVRKNRQKGAESFAKITLLYLCVDELLTAFHLTQHAFVNQAYAHIRSVFENIDKIELFNQNPVWAELWASNKTEDRAKARHELSSKNVRIKLGRKAFDPIYGMFSELGPHGTLKGIQSRTAMKISNSKENFEITTWIGGCPFEHNIIWLSSFLLYALMQIILKITDVYQEYLSEEEVGKILHETAMEFKEFTINHYLTWAKKEGFDVIPLEKALEKLTII